jgi:hypothetical protein
VWCGLKDVFDSQRGGQCCTVEGSLYVWQSDFLCLYVISGRLVVTDVRCVIPLLLAVV